MIDLTKSRAALLDCTFGWEDAFRPGGERVAADLGWVVEPGPGPAGGIVVEATSVTPRTTTAFLSGGVPGEAYLVSSRIRTTAGREFERSVTIRIPAPANDLTAPSTIRRTRCC